MPLQRLFRRRHRAECDQVKLIQCRHIQYAQFSSFLDWTGFFLLYVITLTFKFTYSVLWTAGNVWLFKMVPFKMTCTCAQYIVLWTGLLLDYKLSCFFSFFPTKGHMSLSLSCCGCNLSESNGDKTALHSHKLDWNNSKSESINLIWLVSLVTHTSLSKFKDQSEIFKNSRFTLMDLEKVLSRASDYKLKNLGWDQKEKKKIWLWIRWSKLKDHGPVKKRNNSLKKGTQS